MAHPTPQSRYLDDLLSSVPRNNPIYAQMLFQFAISMSEKYQKDRNPQHLEEAISRAEQAVVAITVINDAHLTLPSYLDSLAHMLELRYDRTGELSGLSDAIQRSQQAVEAMPSESPERIIYLNNLGNLYGKRFQKTGREEDLTLAIKAAQQCVDIIPEESPHLSAIMTNLSGKLEKRFQLLENVEDLNQAIKFAENALQAADTNDTNLWIYLQNLANMLEIRYDWTNMWDDLNVALRHAERLVLRFSDSHSNSHIFLNDLANKLWRRYDRDGRVEDLDEAINKIEQAISILPDDHPSRPGYFNNLGNLFEKHYDRMGKIENLNRAIRETERAISTIDAQESELGRYLNSLGNKVEKRFQKTGRIEDLEEAIDLSQRAVDLTTERLSLAVRSVCLANKLEKRSERVGRMGDLEDAIDKLKQAIRLTPEHHPDQVKYLNNLSNMLERRFDRFGDINDLEEACKNASKSVRSIHENHPDLPMYLNNLGNKLRKQYQQTGDVEKIQESLRNAEKAVEKTPVDHPDRALYLNNLANQLQRLYRAVGEMETLEKAIRVGNEAVKLTPAEDPSLVVYSNTLGGSYILSPESFHRDKALECFLRGWNCQNGVPFHRVASVHFALLLLQERKEWIKARNIARQAVELLSVVNTRLLSREDQQFAVSHFSGLAAVACSLSLETGDDGYEALEVLEQGRGSILSFLVDDRGDISKLKADHPEQGERYNILRAEVSESLPETSQSGTRQSVLRRRQAAAQELEVCINEIRKHPKYVRFLRGLSKDELIERAAEGSIVVINVTDIRSDAIIVSQSCQVKVVSLPKLKAAEIKEWIQKDLTKFRREEYGKKNKLYREFLLWLWASCVKIVVGEIERETKSKDDRRRIWWIGSGAASSLPFHAAGDHSSGSTNNTFSRAISSYTPTIKALGYARERVSKPVSGKPRLLLVAMHTTPGEEALPGVSKEISEVRAVVETSWSVKSEEGPNADTVLNELKKCEIAHFACHGLSDFANPSNSHLILQKFQSPGSAPVRDLLTVRQISEIDLKHAKIAYLSACSTAENKAQNLVDEVLHLASGFQVAGFGHVIATMWPAGDDVCVEVAKTFYSQIVKSWGGGKSYDAIAAALHTSTMKIREKYRRQPLAWAQFIHSGV